MSVRLVTASSMSHTEAAATQTLCPGRDRQARDTDRQTEERTRSEEATVLRSEIGKGREETQSWLEMLRAALERKRTRDEGPDRHG